MFSLKLGTQNGQKTIDFTESMWGHALHGSTFSEEPLLPGDDASAVYRYSIMAHSAQRPNVGDKIRFKANSGIREDEIYEVIPCGNPDDMFTLKCLQRRNPQQPNQSGVAEGE